jgi:hypothetical protein
MTPHGRERLLRSAERVVRHEASVYVLAVVIATVVATFAMKLWLANWSVPFYYGIGDANLISASFKTVAETGWYEVSHLLGAPGGQYYFDWKEADNLQYMWAGVLDAVFRNPFVAQNVYYVLGFPLAALTGAWFFRVVGLSKVLTIVMAVLFAIAPYHFIRNEQHMWYSEYYCVPVGLVLVYRVLASEAIWGRRPDSRFARGIFTGRGAQTIAIFAMLGTASTYFSVFTLFLLGFAGLIALIRTHAWRRFWGAVGAAAFLVGVVLVNLAPPTIYSLIHGTNAQAVVRSPLASYTYSLRMSDLLLPMPNDRIGVLATIRAQYEQIFGSAEQAALGLIASIGFIAAIVVVAYLAVSRLRRTPAVRKQEIARTDAIANLSVLTVLGFLISTAGGLSFAVTLFTSDLRGWNRISIMLALFCLAIVGLLVDSLLGRLARKRDWRQKSWYLAWGTTAVVLLGVGYFDQTAPGEAVPRYAAVGTQFSEDANLVSAIQRSVPTGSSILQLPYQRFPETAAVNGVNNSDQLLPYLHSSTLKWSGGGIKGRALVEWQGALARLPVRQLLLSATSAGFSGVLIDTKEYGSAAPAILAGMTGELGAPTTTGEHGRFVFYSLAAAANDAASLYTPSQRATIGERTTHAVYPYFVPNDSADGYAFLPSILAPYKPEIALDNPTSHGVRVKISFTVTYVPGGNLTMTLPGGAVHPITLSNGTADVSVNVTVPAGRSGMPIALAAGTPFARTAGIDGVFRLTKVEATDPALVRLLAKAAG